MHRLHILYREKELAKVTIKKEDVELIVSIMRICLHKAAGWSEPAETRCCFWSTDDRDGDFTRCGRAQSEGTHGERRRGFDRTDELSCGTQLWPGAWISECLFLSSDFASHWNVICNKTSRLFTNAVQQCPPLSFCKDFSFIFSNFFCTNVQSTNKTKACLGINVPVIVIYSQLQLIFTKVWAEWNSVKEIHQMYKIKPQ